jgi:dihydrofolate reductase
MRPALKPVIIAAVAKNGVIGDSETRKLPWPGKYPKDLQLFRETVRDTRKLFKESRRKPEGHGSILIGGRHTWEEIFEAIRGPIPLCDNIVLSTTMQRKQGIFVAKNMPSALAEAERLTAANPLRRTYVIGGGSVYRQMMEFDFVEWMLISHLDGEHHGDIKLEIDNTIWRKYPLERYTDFEQVLYSRISKHG